MASLGTYRKKRDFAKTPEPRGQSKKNRGHSYVIQEHAARRLHYDFRLELDGVLKSWAVPKGPSLDPSVKRLAVETEDHPVEYGGFEGVIPKGEYGAGRVLLWDRGTWEPLEDPHQGYEQGKLEFELFGQKLHGVWRLIRTRSNWLLMKAKDREARSGKAATIVDVERESVESGKTLDQIGHKAMPEFIEPELATLVKQVPDGDRWLHEIKFDGYRIMARVEAGKVRLLTRRGHDWTSRMPRVAEAVRRLAVDRVMLDGEVVVLRPDGISDFQLLQNSLDGAEDRELDYFVFDLLHENGEDLTKLPLEQRKQRLRKLLAKSRSDALRESQHLVGAGPSVFESACSIGVEGVVSKLVSSPYRSGRGHDWLKTKCVARQELVIGGFTEPSGGRNGLGALLLGMKKDGELVYAGKVGTGFSNKSLEQLAERLRPLVRKTSPFSKSGTKPRGRVHFVEPTLVAEVEFISMTREGLVRHASFRGLREDKPARDVVREVPKLTHPDRVLYPEAGITKLDLATYYEAVRDFILPQIVNRPLTLFRCPEGRAKNCFFQKHASEGMPEGLIKIPIREAEGKAEYLMITGIEGLLGLVQMGVLEIHTWGSRTDRVEYPDELVLDIDPDPDLPWSRVVEAAHHVRSVFERMELRTFVKTTGGKGLHVCVPIDPKTRWPEAKEFMKTIATFVAAEHPREYVVVSTKAKRKGRIFLDYLRNGRGATFVAPYSTRARPGAPVAMPVSWQELDRGIDPQSFDMKTAVSRVRRRRTDPWAEFSTLNQALPRLPKR